MFLLEKKTRGEGRVCCNGVDYSICTIIISVWSLDLDFVFVLGFGFSFLGLGS